MQRNKTERIAQLRELAWERPRVATVEELIAGLREAIEEIDHLEVLYYKPKNLAEKLRRRAHTLQEMGDEAHALVKRVEIKYNMTPIAMCSTDKTRFLVWNDLVASGLNPGHVASLYSVTVETIKSHATYSLHRV